MKEVKNGKGTFVFVEVPEGAWRFYSRDGIIEGRLGMDVSTKLKDGSLSLTGHGVKLPPGSFTFIGATKDITEEKAGEIVESVNGWSNVIYHNYTASGRDYRDVVESAFKTATESLQSLLTSQGLDSKLHYAILKKEV